MERIFACLLLLPLSANAGTLDRANRASLPVLGQSYTWFDGDKQKTVWLDPSLVAEFGTHEKNPTDSAARSLSDKQKKPFRSAGALLWPMGTKTTGNAAVSSLAATDPAGSYSQIFRDGPRAGGSMKALTGNIIVTFRPEWSESRIEAWAKSQQMEIVRKLATGPKVYVLKHRPGLASLLKANELHTSGEVLQATPDWWLGVKPL